MAPPRAVKSCTVYPTGHVIAGRYTVERMFEGGMGYVYITRDKAQNLRFAIKQPKAMMLQIPDFFVRVVREADAWTGLGMHPHVAYCYFVRNIEDIPHIFVEYVDGGTLQDWIADGKCLDYRVGLDLAMQCCHGMERAHGRGLLHRDLKPANILVTGNGLAKVTDFGLVGEATLAERQQTVGKAVGETSYGMQMGTPEYMAPEQGRDPRRRSATVPEGVWYDSDVYSFGLCLWEMVCGRRPFAHWSANTGQPLEPREARRDLPASLRTLLLDVIARDRRQRPQDFGQLRERLNGIYRELFKQDAPHYRIQILDTSAAELNNQGYSYSELGKPVEALTCFRQAVEKDPTHPQAVYNLSLLQWRKAEIDDLEVLRRLENCGNNPENSAETLAELTAQVHAERSDPDAARSCLEAYPGRYEALFAGIEIKPIRCLRTLVTEYHIKSATVTSDGQRVLSGGDKTLTLWELATGKCLCTLNGHTESVNAVALTSEGRRALSGSWDKTLKLWDLATGQCLRTLTGYTGSAQTVVSDGRRALSGSADQTIKIWDLVTGQCLRTLTGHTYWVDAVAVFNDGRRALSASRDKTLKLWDLDTGDCLRTLTGHTGWVQAVAVTGDGHRALSGDSDGTLKLWDLETGWCLRTLTGHTEGVHAVAVTGDGRRALSGSQDKTLKIWELTTGRCLRTLTGHTGRVNTVTLISDGRQALSGSEDQTFRLWNLVSRAYRAVPQIAPPRGWAEKLQAHTALQQALAKIDTGLARSDFRGAYATLFAAWKEINFRPDVALQDRYSRLICQGRITNLRVGYPVKTLSGHTDEVSSLVVASDGRRALSGSNDTTLKLWDLETGKCRRTLAGHMESVEAVAMTGDGRRALSGSYDNTLKLWDLETGKCLRTLTGHTKAVSAVALTSDGRRALSGSKDKTLKLWDLITGECLRTLIGTGGVGAVAMIGEGRLALSGSGDDLLMIWDLATGQCLRTLTVEYMQAVAVTSDGRRALWGNCVDYTLELKDLTTGECLRTLTGHTEEVLAVVMTSDGRRALSGSDDMALKLWDLETGQCLHTLNGHTGGINAVALTSDGQWALSGGQDNNLILWQFIWDLEFPKQASR
jgi:WD40 repeat protein